MGGHLRRAGRRSQPDRDVFAHGHRRAFGVTVVCAETAGAGQGGGLIKGIKEGAAKAAPLVFVWLGFGFGKVTVGAVDGVRAGSRIPIVTLNNRFPFGHCSFKYNICQFFTFF